MQPLRPSAPPIRAARTARGSRNCSRMVRAVGSASAESVRKRSPGPKPDAPKETLRATATSTASERRAIRRGERVNVPPELASGPGPRERPAARRRRGRRLACGSRCTPAPLPRRMVLKDEGAASPGSRRLSLAFPGGLGRPQWRSSGSCRIRAGSGPPTVAGPRRLQTELPVAPSLQRTTIAAPGVECNSGWNLLVCRPPSPNST